MEPPETGCNGRKVFSRHPVSEQFPVSDRLVDHWHQSVCNAIILFFVVLESLSPMPAHKSLAEKRRIAQDLHDGKTHQEVHLCGTRNLLEFFTPFPENMVVLCSFGLKIFLLIQCISVIRTYRL